MLVLWIALTIATVVFVFTLAEVVFARWWIRRQESAEGVQLASEYHVGPTVRYVDITLIRDGGSTIVHYPATYVGQSLLPPGRS